MQRLLTLPRAVELGFWLYFVQLDNKLQYFWYNLSSEKNPEQLCLEGRAILFSLDIANLFWPALGVAM